MTTEQFLQNLLASQDLSPEQERTLQAHKKEVTDFLRAEFGDEPKIKYAGSREKGTLIKENYDLDIVCYFPSTDTRSLKEIREDVSNHLSSKYLMGDKKASAERIKSLKGASAPEGYHIDVVPGRFIEGTSDVFIHVAYGDKERMQTNLKTHIDHITNSGCVPVIRLVKLWAYRNDIHIKTFILELFVVEALSGSRTKDNLESSFLKVMETLKDKFGNLQLVDPANTNNIVSRTISASEKITVAQAGEEAFNQLDGSDDLSDWKAVFGENDMGGHTVRPISTPPSTSSSGFTPQAPWCTDYADRTR